ncbi:MAG: hypothetical protein ACOZE5_00645 [Verrucomicrobiota bacterium]
MKHLLLSVILLGTLALTACAGNIPTAKEKGMAWPAPQTREKYVTQTPLGTWIPKKVKQSEAQASEAEAAAAQEALGDLQRRGSVSPRGGTD